MKSRFKINAATYKNRYSRKANTTKKINKKLTSQRGGIKL